MRLNGRFGASIRKRRMAHGISLRALAREVGISRTYLSMIELGRATPSRERAAIISKALAKRKASKSSKRSHRNA
jgi:transcriptional regulator with XRE-family HTH domain